MPACSAFRVAVAVPQQSCHRASRHACYSHSHGQGWGWNRHYCHHQRPHFGGGGGGGGGGDGCHKPFPNRAAGTGGVGRMCVGNNATPDYLAREQLQEMKMMRSEEQFARDIYRLCYQKFGLRVFQNIQSAEQRHMEAIQNLLAIQGETFAPATVGYYPDPTGENAIQSKWDSLTTSNNILAIGAFPSVVDALKFGIDTEVTDIMDLQQALGQLDCTVAPNAKRVYENLMRASENHLRAFVRNLEATGEGFDTSFTAMNERRVEAILAAGNGRGGRGRGNAGGRRGRCSSI